MLHMVYCRRLWPVSATRIGVLDGVRPQKRAGMFAQVARPAKAAQKRKTKVSRTSSRRLAPATVIVASAALMLTLADARQSFAGCGGYCEARQVRALCHRAVAARDLEVHERDAEFAKCRADPTSYLAVEPLRGRPEIGSD